MKNRKTRKGFILYQVTLFIGISLLTAFNNPCSAQNQANTPYTVLIQQADKALADKDYPTAIMLYEKASYAKPELKYASGKIAEINAILDATADSRTQLFENIIIKAEGFFRQKDYPKAKAEYQKALAIDGTAQFPKDRLGQISALYTDPDDAAYFNDAVANGDKALASADYEKAVLFYETALAVKPDAKAVKDKISNTKKQQAESKVRNEQAVKIIAGADKLLQAEKRTEARAEYQKALDLVPGNTDAKEKIAIIDKYISDKKAIQDLYDKNIELADQFYINRDFANARLKYQEALKAKPEARYPKEMLDKTKSGESQLQSDQQKYDAALASAESLFKSGDYESALIGYKSALAINPAETLPKTRIAETEKLIADRTSRKEAYDIALKNGDQAFNEKKYDPALSHYRNALSLMPAENYPAEKISEITSLQAHEKELDESYKKSLADADKLFSLNKLNEAIVAYTKALEIKPGEVYPQQKITEAQNQLALSKNKEESYLAAIAAADKSFGELNYQEALNSYKQALTIKPNEKYPKDKSDEINKLLVKQKADGDKYAAAIANGDKAYLAGNLPLAMTAFQDALTLKPSEQYPQEKLAEIKAKIADQQLINEKYTAAITSGDQMFTSKLYDKALSSYTEASELKKAEKYPQDQITKINKIIADTRSAEESYSQAIAEGDNSFTNQKLTEAIAAYKRASGIKPSEAYPKSQMEKINSLIAEQKKTEADYLAALVIGDKSFSVKNYNEAISGYRKALELRPLEKYPADKIAEAEKMLADLKIIQDSYDKAVADGDKFFKEKNYTNSFSSFTNAVSLKPSETYPKQKLVEIQAILDKDKAKDQLYQEALTQADKFFNEKKYSEALPPYQRASSVKPDEKYPQDQITRVTELIAGQKKLDQDYLKLITDADVQFKATKYKESRSLYTEASVLKPSEKLPEDKIAEIDIILADLQNKELSFAKYISDGDAGYAAQKYDEALISYSGALKIKPAEVYPKTQIEKINTIISEQKKLEANYINTIATADKLFAAKNYTEAISTYQKALEIKPSEKYPADKIAEAEKVLADLKTQQLAYEKAIADGDKFFADKDLLNSLASYKNATGIKPDETYPKQKMAEIQLILDKDKAEGQRYLEAIAQADKLFADQKLKEAIVPYQLAGTIKPNETYPKDQINKINQLIAEQKKQDEDYLKLITDGETQLKAAKYDDARNLFSDASRLKPAEKLPKDKIAEIDAIVSSIQEKEKNYAAAVSEGDASFAAKKYTEALTSYKNALVIKPAEIYPKSQLDKINSLLAELKKTDEDYLTTIVAADKSFEVKKYAEAIADYRKALTLKPAETYPAEKIAVAEKEIAAQKALQEKYDKAIAEGDKNLLAKEYEPALAAFKTANTAKPAETYPSQKIAEVQAILEKIKAENDRYQEAITLADKFFADSKYREALEPYQRATTIKPAEKYPQDQIAGINKILADQKKADDEYNSQLTLAETQLSAKKYDEAKVLFTKASILKPAETLPKEKLAEIDRILADLKLKEENYTKAINTATDLYASKKLPDALKSYEEALAIKPAEKFPQERIAAIKAELKAIDDSYNKAIELGDSKLASKNLMEALNAFQNAMEIKPDEGYPKSKITEINTALSAQKEEQEKLYASYIAEGDQLFAAKDYNSAKSAFTKATGLKPGETYPGQRISEINKIIEEEQLARKAEYNKALGEADKLYNSKIYDQAIDAYESASKINPADAYPGLQIAKIRKYMSDHAIQDLYSQTLLITEGNEKKFTFSAIELRQRKNNYILLKARSAGKTAPKVFLNYGKDSQKNGGIVLRSLDKTEISDYLIRISVQDKWYREDNNWISLFVESGEIEISKVQIAAGDE